MHPAVLILGGLAALFLLKRPVARSTGAGGTGGSSAPVILLPVPVPATVDPASQDPFQYDWLPLGSCQDGTLSNCLPGDNGYPVGTADPYTVTV